MNSLLPIPDFPQYLVSDAGVIHGIRGKPMRSGSDRRGYCRQPLIRGPKGSRFVVCCYVHRLVAAAFLPPPFDGAEIDHIDGNARNNAASNLRWVTHRENIRSAMDRRGNWLNVPHPQQWRPVAAVDLETGTKTQFPSIAAAVVWLSAQQIAAGGLPLTYARGAGNICHAADPAQGRTAYGFRWERSV